MLDKVVPIEGTQGWKKPGRGGARPGAGRKPGRPALSIEEAARRDRLAAERRSARQERDALWHQTAKDNVSACVYVVHEIDEPAVCKIGITKGGPLARLSSLQVGTWRPLKLAGFVDVADEEIALAVERLVHGAFSGLHCRGEWFRVSAGRAMSEIHTACLQVQVVIEMKTGS